MNRRLHLLPFLLLAIPALSQTASPTVVVLDQSYSMSLPAGESATRLSLLLDGLEERIVTDQAQSQFALIAFEDADEIAVVLPYPATPAAVLSAARDLVPWGTSPILAATRFALDYAGGLPAPATLPPGPTEVILVTDGEDAAAYMAREQVGFDLPPGLADGSIRLTLLTIGGDSPGAAKVLAAWAAQSGGQVVIVDENGQRRSQATSEPRAALDHEISSAVDGSGTDLLARALDDPPVTGFMRILAAWLLVVRWNLAASAVLGIIAFVLSVGTWRRRVAATTRHNALPTQVILEVRTSLRRREYTLSKFPITVGTTAGAALQLTNAGTEPDQVFELRLADAGLRFSSEEKLNINGVPRRSWQLQEGDQVRLGRYRVSFERLITTTPLPLPARTHWRVAGLPAFSIVAATLLFVFQPLAVPRPAPFAGAPLGATRPTIEHQASDSGIDLSAETVTTVSSLPALYGPKDAIRYFDADFMAIHAHPDDETLDFGTLLARLEAAGQRGVVVLLTDGQSGRDQYPRRETGGIYPAHDLTGGELVEVRVAEARRAMAHLGVEAYVRGMLRNFPYNSVTDQLTVSQVLDRWGGLWAIVDALAEVLVGFSPELVVSPDIPRGPYEHFEHEATGVIVATLLDSLKTSGLSTVRGHLIGIDPLQTSHYDDLVEISPWDLNPATGVSFRTVQLRALAEHKTQRDSSVVGIETRLAMPAEYYAVGFWDADFDPPPGIGIDLPAAVLSEMAVPPGR